MDYLRWVVRTIYLSGGHHFLTKSPRKQYATFCSMPWSLVFFDYTTVDNCCTLSFFSIPFSSSMLTSQPHTNIQYQSKPKLLKFTFIWGMGEWRFSEDNLGTVFFSLNSFFSWNLFYFLSIFTQQFQTVFSFPLSWTWWLYMLLFLWWATW